MHLNTCNKSLFNYMFPDGLANKVQAPKLPQPSPLKGFIWTVTYVFDFNSRV